MNTELEKMSRGPSFLMASLLSSYPDDSFRENVGAVLEDDRLDKFTLKALVLDVLQSEDRLNDLRSEYIDLFDRGRQVNSLYETEYGRERAMVKGTDLVDIAAFYRAFGLETGGDGLRAEMIDHVSVELEFYALLLLKCELLLEMGDDQGLEIVMDARRKFLKSHLGRFVGAIGERPGVSASEFYSQVFDFCRELVAEECEGLGLVIEPEHWIAPKGEPEAISCGAAGGRTACSD